MEKFKGLIIENDRGVPIELEAFQQDQASLFSEIRIITHARFYPEDVKEALGEGFNAIIGLSTFIYKDQLENTVMMLDQSPIKYQFFFFDVVRHLNEFVSTNFSRIQNSYQFSNYNAFISVLKKWVQEERVCEIISDYNQPLKDKLHNYSHLRGQEADRFKFVPQKVVYDPIKNIFHLEFDNLSDIQSILKKTHR